MTKKVSVAKWADDLVSSFEERDYLARSERFREEEAFINSIFSVKEDGEVRRKSLGAHFSASDLNNW